MKKLRRISKYGTIWQNEHFLFGFVFIYFLNSLIPFERNYDSVKYVENTVDICAKALDDATIEIWILFLACTAHCRIGSMVSINKSVFSNVESSKFWYSLNVIIKKIVRFWFECKQITNRIKLKTIHSIFEKKNIIATTQQNNNSWNEWRKNENLVYACNNIVVL